MPSNEPVIAVRVPQELYDAIKSHADAENRSMGNYVRVMLVKAFKRSEIEESAHRAGVWAAQKHV